MSGKDAVKLPAQGSPTQYVLESNVFAVGACGGYLANSIQSEITVSKGRSKQPETGYIGDSVSAALIQNAVKRNR